MDNANTKHEIQEYMIKDKYFEESYTKNDLLQVIKAFNFHKEYVCDRMAQEMGRTVLRLPPYYCIFNPIEHMWRQLKSTIRSQNTSPTLGSSVCELIKKVVDEIPVESWKNSVSHVMKNEESYIFVDNVIKSIIINLSDDSDSDTELTISFNYFFLIRYLLHAAKLLHTRI